MLDKNLSLTTTFANLKLSLECVLAYLDSQLKISGNRNIK